jgi:hypothetical protein
MQSIFEIKEQEITETPLLVFECALPNGQVERWSTHRVVVGGSGYEARVLQHNVFEIQTSSDQGVDGIPRISIALANADSHFSEVERSVGWKGARLKVGFVFYDLRKDEAASEISVIFQGMCNPPDEIREATFRITASSRLNLQRLVLPQVRIQRRCPWEFPATDAQRAEAIEGGASGHYSRYYRCGYSAGVTGGSGAVNGGEPFAGCSYSRGDCEARGMFSHFGGLEFVPPAISVRTFGDKNWHTSAVAVNGARYNDFVPMVYGTAWYQPPVVFARNDGNLTRMEVLLGIGEMQGVVKVLVNDVEIPIGVAGRNMTGTGWYNIPTLGMRAGTCNPDFTDGSGQPAGDPYGSMAYLSVVVPNRLNDGTSLPRVQVLAEGLKLPTYTPDGAPAGEQFSSNPAWILLDVLRRMGWGTDEIDITSFARAAAYCDESIDAADLNGNPIALSRFQCNFVLQNRRSAGDLVRGVRNSARMLLSYGADGALQLRVENAVAAELPSKPAWSNSTEPLNGGWLSYEFGDGSTGVSGILRKANGEPSVRVFSRSIAETPNRFSVEFQDALNEYQHDSFSVVDADDVARSGQEVTATLTAIGVPNFDQAARILKLNLDKAVRGNTFIEFDTSVKAFGVRAGDPITVTYLKEGFERQPFRIIRIAPGVNHRVTTITAQIHDDSWYADSNGQMNSAGGRRQSIAGIGAPRPLVGSVLDANGDVQFGVEESATTASDGTEGTSVRAAFVSPAVAAAAGPGIPLLSLAAQTTSGGSLAAGMVLYYAIAGLDAAGNEGAISFLVRASVMDSGSSVILSGLSFALGTDSFNVYRGETPAQLYRIASALPLADRFTDTGLPNLLIAPIDPNFDHANFYWRMELQPEVQVTASSNNTVANGSLEMPANRYRGATVRITRGRGEGQDRAIASNDATTITTARPWDAEPDSSSYFAIAEGGWKFGALSKTSPVEFAIPNQSGETVQITGRAANVNDQECAAELSIVTRWQIGGSGTAGMDLDVAPAPYFGLGPSSRGGSVELSGVSFPELTNTRTISSATLTLYYRDELANAAVTLAGAVAEADTLLDLQVGGSAAAGDFVQIGGEVIRVEESQNGAMRYRVTRAIHGTTAEPHATAAPVYALAKKTAIAPFPPGFFGSPYSGSWAIPVMLPNARIASAELFATNRKGNSATRAIHLTNNDDLGLRTLSGGQYSIQVGGFLAVDACAAPALIIEASHAVQDVYGVLGTPADANVAVELRMNGAAYCTLTFLAGATVSDAKDGNALPPLRANDRVTVAVLSVGIVQPGADLTVLVRL